MTSASKIRISAYRHGKPDRIVLDNGPELTSNAMLAWSEKQNDFLDFIRPGKPIENAICESFNGKFRDECLNENCFLDINHARAIIEDWRDDYNRRRPHSSLGGLTPKEFARFFGKREVSA
jgi:putative transposase